MKTNYKEIINEVAKAWDEYQVCGDYACRKANLFVKWRQMRWVFDPVDKTLKFALMHPYYLDGDPNYDLYPLRYNGRVIGVNDWVSADKFFKYVQEHGEIRPDEFYNLLRES